jgi:hypothetical protein
MGARARRLGVDVNMKSAQRTPSVPWLLIGLVVAACSAREVPATWPDASPASPRAPAAPTVPVTRALEADPPLPGESMNGWAGLVPDGAPAEPTHQGHGAGSHGVASPGAVSPGGDIHDHPHADEAVVYTCPMHPDVVADRPGKCPRCGMTLVKRDAPKK